MTLESVCNILGQILQAFWVSLAVEKYTYFVTVMWFCVKRQNTSLQQFAYEVRMKLQIYPLHPAIVSTKYID